MASALEREAARLAQRLSTAGQRIVFAESCTGGLASAKLAEVAGISQWHCGSAVTYREQTKIDWLGVSRADLERTGVVSDTLARHMAVGVLVRTAEADISAAVTGHLGPAAPPELDGVVYVAVARRSRDGVECQESWRHTLHATRRTERQAEAATLLLQHVRSAMSGSATPPE